jgi:hypothetical protein
MTPCMEVALAKEGGFKAELFYSTIAESGIWLEEPGKSSPYDVEGNPLAEGNLSSRLENRLRQMPYSSDAYEQVLNYRIQLLAAARGGLGTEQRRQVEKLFREARLALTNSSKNARRLRQPRLNPSQSSEIGGGGMPLSPATKFSLAG